MANGSGSMVSRRRLGIELRRLREQAGLSMDEAASRLDDLSQAKVSRLERGRVQRPRVGDIRSVLELYGVAHADVEALLELARGSRGRGWWNSYADMLPEWFNAYVGFESEASQLANYEPQLVPGLLQTDDYIRAITRTSPDMTQEEIDRRIEIRRARQEVLSRSALPLKLWAIVDEAVLYRPFGGIEVMRAQLEHLLEVSQQSNIVLQVLPFGAGAHSALYGAFAVLSFADPTDGDVVYLDVHKGLFLDEATDVEFYTDVLDHLRAKAADPDQTQAYLSKALKELA